jgi:hypothetical protein
MRTRDARTERIAQSPFVLVLVLVLVALFTAACKRRDLRGAAKPSPDGKTYLVVDDDNNGACPLMLDRQPWTLKKGVAGPVTPGVHSLGCKGEDGIAFRVEHGTTFHFDYWGP